MNNYNNYNGYGCGNGHGYSFGLPGGYNYGVSVTGNGNGNANAYNYQYNQTNTATSLPLPSKGPSKSHLPPKPTTAHGKGRTLQPNSATAAILKPPPSAYAESSGGDGGGRRGRGSGSFGAGGNSTMMNAAGVSVNMDRRIGTEEPEYRVSSRAVAILDITSAIVTMGFHMFTIISQESLEERKQSRKDVLVPLTPVQLQLHGYFLVLAWIGIIAVNIVQLLIGTTLLTSTSSEVQATKALSGSRTWIKTCIFILILLLFKLVILYFMSEMGTRVTFTTLTCILEFIIRCIALVTVMKYLHAVTMAFPEISQIFYDAEQLVESPKRNPVTDAVWF